MSKRYLSRDTEDSPIYEVDILGTITTNEGLELTIFREGCHWVQYDVGEVKMLPTVEFEKKFEKFTQVEGGFKE